MEGKKGTLLFVDDEQDLREILAFSFEKKGYVTFQAANAVEAIEIVKDNKIDVVLSDIRMPGGDGIQLLDEIKRYDASIPTILFITGFADVTFEEAYDKGCEAIFEKPFNLKSLAASIEKLIQKEERWKAPHALRADTQFQINIQQRGLSEARKARLLNIGRGGFFVAMNENFPKTGDNLNFRLVFDEGVVTAIEGEGVVRWVRREQQKTAPPGCGVEFVSLDEKARAKVFELINFLKTTQFIPKS